MQVIAVRTDRVRIVADHQRRDFHPIDGDAAGRVGAIVDAQAGELMCRIDFQNELGSLKNVGRKMRRVTVGHHQRGEGVVLEFGAEIQAGRPRQVIEPVAVLQGFELILEHEIET